jgi:hypothetical protein
VLSLSVFLLATESWGPFGIVVRETISEFLLSAQIPPAVAIKVKWTCEESAIAGRRFCGQYEANIASNAYVSFSVLFLNGKFSRKTPGRVKKSVVVFLSISSGSTLQLLFSEEREVWMLRWTLLLILPPRLVSCFVVPTCSGLTNHRQQWRSTARDEYDQFAERFEKVLRKSECSSASGEKSGTAIGKDIDVKGGTSELSPYYRRDKMDYDAEHHALPDIESVIPDPEGVRQLLKDRFHARRSKDFALVVKIDRQLSQDHGVRAFDHPPIWTQSSKAPRAHLRMQANKRRTELQELYGPVGHPYRQVGEQINVAGKPLLLLTMAQIHTSLSRRTRCRMEGRYEKADAIQFELSLYGIRINDEFLQWTVDDRLIFKEEDRGVVGMLPKTHKYYERVQRSAHHDKSRTESSLQRPIRFGGRTLEEDEVRRRQRVVQLVQSRLTALARDEGMLASLLALELDKTYNVIIDDDKCAWETKDERNANETSMSGPTDHSIDSAIQVSKLFPGILFVDEAHKYDSPVRYKLSTRSLQLRNKHREQRIQDLVLERIHKREEGKYLEADAIRRELWNTYVREYTAAFDARLRRSVSPS